MRIRTGYSFKYAVGHLDEVISRIKEIGWTVAPISDRESTFAFAKWAKMTKAAGLRPIYGCELPVIADDSGKWTVYDHWSFFAKDSIAALNDAVFQLTKGMGYAANHLPGLIKIASKSTMLHRLEPAPDFFVPLSPSTPRQLVAMARERGFPLIATGDNVFTRPNDLDFYRIVLRREASTQTYPQHILSDDEWRNSLMWVDDEVCADAIAERDRAMEQCKATLIKAEIFKPKRPKTLRKMCEEGATRLSVDLTNDVYAARLKRELELIKAKDFEDYFYIIADVMQWARTQMVVGPARGSSCGSLVCYLLGITSVDPIPFDLVFERFIDITRADLPDIDIDVSDAQRYRVFDYMREKYGADKIARLGNLITFKARLAMNATAAALQVPVFKTNELVNHMEKVAANDEKADKLVGIVLKTKAGQDVLKEFPTFEIAARVEGHPFAAGQHAAGVMLTKDAIRNYVGVDARTDATMCDKKDAEEFNLLKIDMLGLTQLSIFERTLELLNPPVPPAEQSAWLERIPLDDKKAFDVLNDQKFSGVFQFAPRTTLAGLVTQMLQEGGRIDNIEDLVALTSLVRPGPLNAGAAHSWIRRRCGNEEAESFHASLDPILGKTQGLMVYQEQVMRIAREIGGLTWEEVTGLRRAIGKSMGASALDKWGVPFKKGARERTDMTDEQLNKLWDDMCGFGSYAFNRSHAVAYGIVSYWCCWLKAHHPVEFAAATLDSLSEQAQQVEALREIAAEGVGYVPLDPQRSGKRWTLHGGKLIGPLLNIKGIGDKKADQIIAAREGGDQEKLAKLLQTTATQIDSLSPVRDRVAELFPDFNAKFDPEDIGAIAINGRNHTVYICGKVTKVMLINENDPKSVERRGYALRGPCDSLKLRIADDTGEITCKIGRHEYREFGRAVAEQAKAGKSLFAVQGTVPGEFRMVQVKRIKHLGEMAK